MKPLWPPPITMTSGIRFGYLSVKNAASANGGETPSRPRTTIIYGHAHRASISHYEVRKRKYTLIRSATTQQTANPVSLASPDRIKNWSPLDGLDLFRTGCQHY